LLPDLAQSTAGLPTDPALIPQAGSRCDSGPVKGWKWAHFCCSSRHRPRSWRSGHPAQIPRAKRAVTGLASLPGVPPVHLPFIAPSAGPTRLPCDLP
jgi:hypothetical protein